MTPQTSQERYYVRGEIVEITNEAYGEMTIKDATGELVVYGTYGADGQDRYPNLEEKPVAGDFVLLYANIQMYGDTPEIYSGWITDFYSNAESVNPDDYEEMTLAQAREAEDGDLIQTTGIVSAITYASGVVPNGVLLTDGSSSMYVYDGAIANQVDVGNQITVRGEKDYFILDTETSYANKWGYTGANQIANASLVENDKQTHEIDLSWTKEITVKNLMESPANSDITGLVYQSTAIIHKDAKPGYTNYYINDLDGTTGSYVYTQANGNDFTWLDAYDGKICTVYYTALNAKSTNTGTTWRLLPVKVFEDTDFSFDQDDASQFALDYYAKGQFAEVYQADPSMEVLESVSNDWIDLSGVKLTYNTNDSTAAWFTTENGKTIFHVNPSETKNVKVTITATNGEYDSATAELDVLVQSKPVFDNLLDVEGAISAEVGSDVTVEGIVGPSLVNKVGFYLIDETGVIAVQTETEEELEGLAIGQKVTIQGKRDIKLSTDGVSGQININGATIAYNEFGNTPYPTDSFITGKGVADILDLNTSENIHTTEAYVIEDVTVTGESTQFYDNYYLTQGDDSLRLYCSNAKSQYGWLGDYLNQTIDVEIVPCKWNDRNPYACTILSITDSEGNQIFNTLNFD